MSIHKTMNTLLIQQLTKTLNCPTCYFFFVIISQHPIALPRLHSNYKEVRAEEGE